MMQHKRMWLYWVNNLACYMKHIKTEEREELAWNRPSKYIMTEDHMDCYTVGENTNKI